jgi:protein-S-isoprenylcysteine O-methyltransferase Ste14
MQTNREPLHEALNDMEINVKSLVLQISAMFLVFAAALFLSAGTINWFHGWIFLVMFFGFVVAITLWLFKHDPGLLQERMTGFKSVQHTWDKVFLYLMNLLFFAWLILMPLDAVRFQWSHMPDWLQAAGALVLLCSFYLFYRTFRENTYLSPVVRIQKDRGQTVVTTGPYHYVRHPMYSGFLLFVLGTALLLGSWYGLIFGLILVGGAAMRAVMEERTLRSELSGYDAYMVRVKYRLIPYIW